MIPLVLIGRIRGRSRRLLIIFLLGLILWSVFLYLMRSSQVAERVFLWGKWLLAVGVLLPVIFYHFSVRYTGVPVKRWILPSFYVVFITFSCLAIFNLVATGVRTGPDGYTLHYSPLFDVVAIAGCIVLITSIVNLYQASKKDIYNQEKNRRIYILTGFICLFIGQVFDFLSLLGLPLYQGAAVGYSLFCLIIGLAVLQPHLIEAHIIFRKTSAYLLISIIVGLLYSVVMYLIFLICDGVFPLWAHSVMLIVLVLTLRLFWDKIQKLVDRLYYQGRYQYLNELNRFTWDTHDISDLNQLGSSLVQRISKAFQTCHTRLLLLSESSDFRIAFTTEEAQSDIVLKNDNPMIQWLRTCKGLLYLYDIETVPLSQSLTENVKTELRKIGAELFVPLKTKMNELIGLLLIGKKKSGGLYSEEDMKMIVNVADRVAVELENARLYNVETVIRSELQNQIEKKTEFLHSIAHELKTPLTSLLSSSELLKMDINNITATQRDRIIDNIDRSAMSMNRRVNELLDFARSQTGNLELKLAPSRIENVLNEALDRTAAAFEDKNQTVKLVLPDSLPYVYCDTDKLQQVVVNLLSNASKYSRAGTEIVITAKQSDVDLIVEVADCAQIIELDERGKIFEPYYRGKTIASNGQLPGLGLGLAIARQIIELHKGRIWVESNPGEGNIFKFSVPAQADIDQKPLPDYTHGGV